MRVISGKKEALQAFSISKNVARDALTFHFEEIDKSINSTRDTPMNQRIRPCQLGVAFCDRPKSSKLLQGIFLDRKSTRLNSSHLGISYAVFCLKKKKVEVRRGHGRHSGHEAGR